MNVRRVPTFHCFFFFFTENYTRLFFPAIETERIRVRFETDRYRPVRIEKNYSSCRVLVDRKQYVHHVSRRSPGTPETERRVEKHYATSKHQIVRYVQLA